MAGRREALTDGLDYLVTSGISITLRKLDDNVVHVVWPDAPMTNDSAVELTVNQQVLQYLMVAKPPLQLGLMRPCKGIRAVQHEDSRR